MYRIQKSEDGPDILSGKGKSLTDELKASADSGATEFEFDNRVYAHSAVKTKLKREQRGKCAYCERSLNGDYGAVEHFRPKGGYAAADGALRKPGYYWLAYDWDNLLLSCDECNTGCKRNLFPLEDENARDIGKRDVSREEPLLINPAQDDPGDCICFERFVVKPRLADGKENRKGRTSIDILRLNDRNDLLESRRRRWEEYIVVQETISKLESILEMDIAKDLKNMIEEALALSRKSLNVLESDESEFTGMFRYQID